MSFLSGSTPPTKNPGTTPGGCHQTTFVEVTGNTCNALLLSGILDNITMAPFIQELHIALAQCKFTSYISYKQAAIPLIRVVLQLI